MMVARVNSPSTWGETAYPLFRCRSGFYLTALASFCLSVTPLFGQNGETVVPEVATAARQVIILQPGVDEVWGNYVFAVKNTTTRAVAHEVRVMLPVETSRFEMQAGAGDDEVTLDESGSLIVSKEFVPGTTFISVGFAVPAVSGEARLTLVSPEGIGDFSVLVPRGGPGLVTGALRLDEGSGHGMGERYDTYRADGGLRAGERLDLLVSGIPEGRGRYWVIGAIAGLVMFAGGAGLGLRTRPGGVSGRDDGHDVRRPAS